MFGVIIARHSFFRQSGLSRNWLLAFFALKILAAWLYGYIHLRYYNGGDTWMFLTESQKIYDTLWTNPLIFLELTFGPNGYAPPPHLKQFASSIFGWSDMRTYFIYRINALLHLVAGGYYSVHALFWCFFSLTGLVALFRVFASIYPNRKKAFAVLLFGLPSLVFWGSGIHKEGLSLFFIGVLLWQCYQWTIHRHLSIKQLGFILLCSLGLFIMRFYIIALLLPAVACWLWLVWRGKNSLVDSLKTYGILYSLGGIVLIVLSCMHPKLNIFAKLAELRLYYVKYKPGGSDIPMEMLPANWYSFALDAPKSLFNIIFLPYWEPYQSKFIQAVSFENFMLIAFVVICLPFVRLRRTINPPFALFCLFFSITYFLLIGITTDNIGAIARYRVIALPFWIGFFLMTTDFDLLKTSTLGAINRIKSRKKTK